MWSIAMMQEIDFTNWFGRQGEKFRLGLTHSNEASGQILSNYNLETTTTSQNSEYETKTTQMWKNRSSSM